ncbi:hypothetical protein FIV42_13520 [Persicimonas caeni]|uniref:Uncharacterized protein n=1 Tax=Persicimonas caeni TaxID=2292766 RepID=A0A4Y6PUE1_PERCE|nr:MYXO-CTERM sorting domain-containing protein [Persicimonas caeni]QDG51729.1 hypothetical protein FIV42_13520 [Persicimonas caeni]QED32950.1 hypothetical protein FRD00_13515 [Persicimonas caeni]
MTKQCQLAVHGLCISLLLLLAPGTLSAEWRAPNVHSIFSGSTFANGQSQNMGPAIRHTVEEYCDTLRFGLTMHAAVDGRRTQCGWGDRAANQVVAPAAGSCRQVGRELQGMQNQSGREYCDQSGDGWQYEPLDQVLRVEREMTFPEAYDSNLSVDTNVLSRWWERANLNLIMLERMPQTDNGDHGDRLITSLREACRSYDGHGGQFPSMPTFVLGMKHNPDDVSLYGGLLAAAGGTGQCCYDEDGCDIETDPAIDICTHIEDGRDEDKIRYDIAAQRYDCGGSAKLTETGAPDSTTLPNLECALAGKKCSGAFAPDPPTNFFGIFACIQVRPKDVPPEDFAVRYCHDDELNCHILTEGSGLEYVDENKTLYYLEGVNQNGTSYCSALGEGDATFEHWDCPNEGNPCDTGLPGRCGQGKISCDSGTEECVQTLAPMPEICNGLDDDCNGQVDNLSTSWDNQLFSVYDPTKLGDYDDDGVDREAIHCMERDVCTCQGGTLDYGGPGYEAHIMSWVPGTCVCGEGMAGESAGYTPAPSSDQQTQPRAGCSSATNGSATIAWMVFGLLGLMGLRRRGE